MPWEAARRRREGNELHRGPRSPGQGLFLSLLLSAPLLTSCDLPTESPQWEQRWILPADEFSLEVEEILPDHVGITPDGTAFLVDVDPVVFQTTLGSLCALCAPLEGQFVPKPPFQGDFHHTISFPDEVESVVVRQGEVLVVATNNLGFDPIRPPGGQRGSLTLTLRDGGPGGRVLDQETWNGTTASFPPGGTLSGTFTFTGPVGSSLHALVTVDSPAGGLDAGSRVPVRLQDQLQVSATAPPLEVTSATVEVAGRVFDMEGQELDVGDVDQELVDRVVSGALELEITNPWGVGAGFTLVIDGPEVGVAVTRTIAIPPGPSSTVRVEFSQDDLRSFLGKEGVTLGGQGTVSSSAGSVTATPSQLLLLDAKLDLILRIG